MTSNMVQFLFGYLWEECPQKLAQLAKNYTWTDEDPKAVLYGETPRGPLTPLKEMNDSKKRG